MLHLKDLVGDYQNITSWIRKYKLVVFSFTYHICMIFTSLNHIKVRGIVLNSFEHIIFVKIEELVFKILLRAKGLLTTDWDFVFIFK